MLTQKQHICGTKELHHIISEELYSGGVTYNHALTLICERPLMRSTVTPNRSMSFTVMSTYGSDTKVSEIFISTPDSPLANGAAMTKAVRN